MEKRPNIVLIMADQMAYDVIGALGHPAVKTPHLDRLAENGVLFTNFYCNSPLCVPSRASFLTGKLPSEIEVYDNGSELKASQPTFVHYLRLHGYETILAGKMHFIGPDQLHGFEHRLTKDIHTAGFELTPDWSKGVYANPGTSIKRLQNPGECDTNTQLLFDERVYHRAIERIREIGRKERERPFFLCVSFAQPHDAFVMMKEYWDLFKDADVPMPKSQPERWEDMHPYNRWIQTHHEADQIELSEEQIRNNRRAYYAMVSYIDDRVGGIVRELERMRLMDNTVVLFTSDHGEMLGERGMWFKRTYFEPSVKVPLIISGPGRLPCGKRVEQVASLLDLGATILSLAGVEERDRRMWEADTRGESLLPLFMSGGKTNWKDEAIIEYLGEGTIRPMVAIRKGRYKYIHVHGHEPVLYDLKEDPLERFNVVLHPKLQPVAAEFQARIAREYDMARLDEKVRNSQRQRLLLLEALRTGRETKWDHLPAE